MGVGVASQPPAPAGARLVERIKAPFAKAGVVKPKQTMPATVAQHTPPTQPSPQLYTAMAEMSQRAGNADQARSLYQKALALDPNDMNALLGAAHMEDRLGRLDVALPLYQRAVNVSPTNAGAINDLALCQARKGDLASAHRALEKAVLLQPQNALYRNNIAKVMVEMNWTDQALGQLSAIHPPAIAHYNMGVLLTERGRRDEAMRFLHTAAAIDPSLAPAKQLLAELGVPPTTPAGEQPVLQTARLAPGMAAPVDHSILPTPQTGTAGLASTEPWPSNSVVVPAGTPGQPVSLPPVE
jgi:tetratricopeptide (TPR) repeat protein